MSLPTVEIPGSLTFDPETHRFTFTPDAGGVGYLGPGVYGMETDLADDEVDAVWDEIREVLSIGKSKFQAEWTE